MLVLCVHPFRCHISGQETPGLRRSPAGPISQLQRWAVAAPKARQTHWPKKGRRGLFFCRKCHGKGHGEWMKSDEKQWKVMTSDKKWWKLMKSDEKWWQVTKSDEKWWKVMKSDDKWQKVMKSDEKWWKVMTSDKKWWKVMKFVEQILWETGKYDDENGWKCCGSGLKINIDKAPWSRKSKDNGLTRAKFASNLSVWCWNPKLGLNNPTCLLKNPNYRWSF